MTAAAADSTAIEHHRAKLAQSEFDLRRSLRKLEDAAREELDIGRKLAEYSPVLALAGFGVGVWLGSRASVR